MENPSEPQDTSSGLLQFMDIASSSIKLVLDKPTSRKRVNHRKYIQRQIKTKQSSSLTSNGQKSDKKQRGHSQPIDKTGKDQSSNFLTSGVPTSPNDFIPISTRNDGQPSRKMRKITKPNHRRAQQKSLQDLFDPRTLHEKCCTDNSTKSNLPLRGRPLPSSFFTEPSQTADDSMQQSDTQQTGYTVMQSNIPDTPDTWNCNSVVPLFGYSSPQHDSLDALLSQQDLSDILSPECVPRQDHASPSSSYLTEQCQLEPISDWDILDYIVNHSVMNTEEIANFAVAGDCQQQISQNQTYDFREGIYSDNYPLDQ
ncbi:uncharacterized protein LOC141906314 [Tubulanus polymorphus]|uniref:uncharacterized protein LOC141906314 n=1 Tax=Tubulanus polymorphus TaxID=672921 RepID=UPI003DA213E5